MPFVHFKFIIYSKSFFKQSLDLMTKEHNTEVFTLSKRVIFKYLKLRVIACIRKEQLIPLSIPDKVRLTF